MTQELQIIREVLDGDIESFRLIVERYEKPVVRMVRNITCDGHTAEDVAQDVFLTAYRKLGSFDMGRSSFATWLFTIARNKSINVLRKKRPQPIGDPPEQAALHEPSEAMSQRELLAELDNQLAQLPGAQRRAFVLAEFEQLSYEQIAQIEKSRIGTIRSRISRAKGKLRSAIARFCEDEQ
jgi:RNA polymerase sigma-70 factor (ECF subfamily)